MTRTFAVLLLVATVSCASRKSNQPQEVKAAAPATRYRVGDYVVYKYEGTFTSAPVVLTERVVEQQGNRLTLDVVVTRGNETRHWVQVVTDTPENQQNNAVDELYEFIDGHRVKLDNVNNMDVYRLYDWTYIMPEGNNVKDPEQQVRMNIAGTEFACTRRSGTASYKGKPIRWESHHCPDFLWTNGLSRFWRDDPPEEVNRAGVEKFGREGPASP